MRPCDECGGSDCVCGLRERIRKLAACREVLMKLAPHVAVQARNISIAPENRAELLAIEPEMLRVLLETK